MFATLRRFTIRFARGIRWTLRAILLFLVLDFAYLMMVWPDWGRYANGAIPKSAFIERYQDRRADEGWPPLKWNPVPLARIPRSMRRAVIVAEDGKFYKHEGFDFEAIQEAVDRNLDKKRVMIGASTISQQTAKNLFLSPSRNPIRKWHEIFYTVGIERNLSKRRILEIYLNVAEFGRGIYGVEAASRHYYGVSVSEISAEQAIELAATLPGPVKNNPAMRTRYFQKHTRKIVRLYRHYEALPPRKVAETEVPVMTGVDTGPIVMPEAVTTVEGAAPVVDPAPTPESP